MRRLVPLLALLAALLPTAGHAQTIVQSRGVDSRVDYASLTRIGPWDDRNYALTQEDLSLLAANEAELDDPVPAFYRVELRRRFELPSAGPVQYPFSALPQFFLAYGGYLVDGKLYRGAERHGGRFQVVLEGGIDREAFETRELSGESRVTTPNGGAESAVALSPVNTELVIAGSNGPGSGQKMHYSTDGGVTWTQVSLPLGGTCCDPTVAWSSDGTKAYAATLAGTISEVWFYRSADGGMTWDDLTNEPPGGDPRREIGSGSTDKEFIHVDTSPTSPFQDNVYLTWHQSNVLQFSRSTDLGHTWSAPLAFSGASDQRGLASDITTDAAGNIYYLWPAFNSRKIWVRKSSDGGASFDASVEVATTNASFNFPLLSQETRQVAVVVSADADLSGGAFDGSVYAAWNDVNAPTSSAANNHSQVKVAYSRNGGATWTVTVPHETADVDDVDRWQPWVRVGPDGTVHVAFYDTRDDPTRTSVHQYYARSLDGGATWSTPQRMTTAISPNISSSFEFGDYNGLDVIAARGMGIFTDNRSEGGGGGDSRDVYVVGFGVGGIFTDGFESGNTTAWSATVP